MPTHRTIIVSAMSSQNYHDYGHDMYSSYLGTTPPIEMAVYSEHDLPTPHLKLTQQEKFVERNLHRTHTSFKYDAVKFCYKPYAIKTAMDFYSSSAQYTRLLWIDADTRFKQQITEDWITQQLYDPHAYLSYYGRPNYHSETGVMLFNLEHPYTKTYVNTVVDLYNTDNIFLLKEWHDSYVWDYVREQSTEHAHNISKDIPKVPGGHIINYCIGDTLDHMKGKRKYQGYSKEQQQHGK